jgi:hypothetical protein
MLKSNSTHDCHLRVIETFGDKVRYTCDACLLDTPLLPPPPAKINRNCKQRGPGTHLASLLGALAIKPSKCDGTCDEWRHQMDVWGADGCRQHRDEILSHLGDAYRTSSLATRVMAGMTAVRLNALAMAGLSDGSPLTISGLLDEAIRRADVPALAENG